MILDRKTMQPTDDDPFVVLSNEELDELAFRLFHELSLSSELQQKWESIQQQYIFVLDEGVTAEEQHIKNIEIMRELGFPVLLN